jgi:hypothetical protein
MIPCVLPSSRALSLWPYLRPDSQYEHVSFIEWSALISQLKLVRFLTDTGYCLLESGTSAATWVFASDNWIGSGITSERAVRAMNLGVGIGVTSKPTIGASELRIWDWGGKCHGDEQRDKDGRKLHGN